MIPSEEHDDLVRNFFFVTIAMSLISAVLGWVACGVTG